MIGRRPLAAAVFGALLLSSGGAMSQSFEAAFDAAVGDLGFSMPDAGDAPGFSADPGTTGFNETDFDFVSRATASGISEALITTAGILEEALEELLDSGLTPEEIKSVVNELQGIVILCLDGGTCEPPEEEPPTSPEP